MMTDLLQLEFLHLFIRSLVELVSKQKHMDSMMEIIQTRNERYIGLALANIRS